MKDSFHTTLSVNDIFERLAVSHYENLGAKPFASGSIYLDNGEGRSAFVNYSIEAKDTGFIIVSMLKSDIPHYWRWQADEIFDEAFEKVKGVIEN